MSARAPAVARKALSEEIQDAAERSDERNDEEQDPMVQQVSQISSVGDAASASAAIRTIDGATKQLQAQYAIDDGATPEHVAQNATTQGHLEILIDRSNVLDLKADRFSQLYKHGDPRLRAPRRRRQRVRRPARAAGGLEVDDRGKLKWQGKQVAARRDEGPRPRQARVRDARAPRGAKPRCAIPRPCSTSSRT